MTDARTTTPRWSRDVQRATMQQLADHSLETTSDAGVVCPLRTYLFSPASDLDRCRTTLVSAADAALIDLEDGVAADEKQSARRTLERLLTEAEHTVHEIHVRVNQSDDGFDRDDLQVAVHPKVQAIRLPKVASAHAVVECAAVVDELTAQLGMEEGSVRLYATIESGLGMQSALAGALAQRHVSQLVFATGDLLSELGFLSVLADGEPTLVARSQLVVASAAMGLGPPVDGVYPRRTDSEGLRRATQWAADLGFFGKSVVDDAQVRVVHDVLTPTEEAVERAYQLLASDRVHSAERAWAQRMITMRTRYRAWDDAGMAS